ncbi:MAG TPA: carbamoyltransferase C-terminal domain-containing protein, partial [Desulfomonilia bacterium]|nr:carbamoyltransferase C-terminal domain-containing protein [Desulfomonilia bacterium]
DYRNINPISNIYWGPEYSNIDAESAIKKSFSGNNCSVEFHDDIDRYVGKQVARGKIIGRLRGRMEWGARALGNRSIIADPRSQNVIHRINKAIKMRDFWMPFAPAILDRYAKEYLNIRDNFKCPFMVMAFDTTKKGFDEITAGTHPFDQTARAQIVDRKNHSSFYSLIEGFEEETGVGGVLNTSFNLHGDPIVCSPEDAIYTFVNSDLDALQIENYYIERK